MGFDIMAKAIIEIDNACCKGCYICVELCPRDALEIKDFKAAVKDIERCTACMSCELRCPDFAIVVTKL